MNILKQGIMGAVVSVLLATPLKSSAIVGLGIERQCTNIVISWPSVGNEYYLIQYRPTVSPESTWVNLTNNYHANSTNRTTYTIFGVCPPCSDGGGGTLRAGGGSGPSTPMVQPKDESRAPVPLGIYPPGIDLSGWTIIWPDSSTDEWSAELVAKWRASREDDSGGMQRDSIDDEPGPDSGFFRVFHIPDWTFNVTNYVYDGPTFFAVDFKDYRDLIENIEVLIDGVPSSDAVFVEYGGDWGMGIYFDLLTNGTHQIQLRSTLRLNDETGDTEIALVLSNLTRTIVVDNEVMFPNWNDMIVGTNTTFQAHTKTNVTDWTIEIYDYQNNYINGGSGHTTNGLISWTWDLKDTTGAPRDDLDADPYFNSFITFAAVSGGSTTRYTPSKQSDYPNTGAWLFSYEDRFYVDAGTNYETGQSTYTNGVLTVAGGLALHSLPYQYFPIAFGTNIYTQTDRNNSWANLKAYLFTPQYRNFYYYGHGGANEIGSDLHTLDKDGVVTTGRILRNSKSFLTSQTVSNELTFNRYSGSRPYRFVWLDGCSTANGNWPGAFGVTKSTNSLSFYTNAVTNPRRTRPSAFVGWNQPVGGTGWGTVSEQWNFRSQWMFDWSQFWSVRTVVDAYSNARSLTSWPPGGNSQLWGALKVYGYTDMKLNEYNQKADWP